MLLCKLGYTTCFATIAFIRLYFGFSVLWLLYYTCSCHAFPLIFYSTSLLLLSYHTMSSSCLILLVIYLLVLACLCLRHDFFNACLWFEFVDTLVLVYARHLAYTSPFAGEYWLLWILMSRSQSLDWRGSSCWGPSLLLRNRQTSCSSSPIIAPPSWLATSPAISWAPFCTVHACTSLCILAFAPIGDVIFL